MPLFRYSLSFGVCLLFAVPAFTQPASATEGWPEADSSDVASIGSIIHAIYETISGPAGEERDWDRFRSLLHPDARLIPIGRTPDGVAFPVSLGVNDYIERAKPAFLNDGFYEVETSRKVETYGYMTHLFSTYEARLAEDAEPFDRGINSFQLLHDGSRWWIMSIFWNSEATVGEPIPEMYGG
ncbi:MAG: hypothetical protein RhofKO_02790 [Rhodothermales bacterium]